MAESQGVSQVIAPAEVQSETAVSTYIRQGSGGMDWGRVVWDTMGINAYYENMQNAVSGVGTIVNNVYELVMQGVKEKKEKAKRLFMARMKAAEELDPESEEGAWAERNQHIYDQMLYLRPLYEEDLIDSPDSFLPTVRATS
jgi:hypothetical protein